MTEQVTKEALEARFKSLTQIIKQLGTEAHTRVGGHIRAITDGKAVALGVYHVAPSIPMETKFAAYKEIAIALGVGVENGVAKLTKPDWSKLKGQVGAGAKKADEPDAPVPQPILQPRQVAPEPEATPVIVRPTTAPKDPTPAPRPVAQTDPSDLAAAILKAIESRAPAQPVAAATVDDGTLRLLIGEEIAKLNLHSIITEANNNGAFPMDRVVKVVMKIIDDQVEERIQKLLAHLAEKQAASIADMQSQIGHMIGQALSKLTITSTIHSPTEANAVKPYHETQ